MADIELELLSRAITTHKINELITAQIEARHFVDPESRAVFETCVEHYSIWGKPMSLDAVKRRHPNYRVVPCSDELGYLIQEFRYNRVLKFAISRQMEVNRMLAEAEKGNREILTRIPELIMESAREVAVEIPMVSASRFSDMGDRLKTIREQQRAGAFPGVSTGIRALDPYVRAIRVGEFFVHCGFSTRGKTQGLVRSSVPAYAAGDVVLMNSLEMSPDEIWEIYDAEAARLSRRAIQFRELSEQDYERYEKTAARVRSAQNDIVYVRVETVDKLAAMVERYGAKTVCVDYVSLMESQRRSSSDWERVKDVSQSLKRLAGHMGVRVYAAAQNSKDAALNGPTEDNIAYSSAIFYDCNVMVGYHQTAEWARMGKVQTRLIKNRGGDKGPPGDSGYFEVYEHWDRDRMIMTPWQDGQDEWMAKIKAGNSA